MDAMDFRSFGSDCTVLFEKVQNFKSFHCKCNEMPMDLTIESCVCVWQMKCKAELLGIKISYA